MSNGLDWRWVGLGALIMFGLSFVAGMLVSLILGPSLVAGAASGGTVGAGPLLLSALVSFGAFVVGGYIVGLKSPGRTILEPGISAAIAVVVGLLIGGAFTLTNIVVGAIVPFLSGLLGGWLGERAQGTRPLA